MTAVFAIRRAVTCDQQALHVEGSSMERNGECHAAFDKPVCESIPNFHLAASINLCGNSLISNPRYQNWFPAMGAAG